MLVTGNSNGRITFYNYQLKLLYWCQNCYIDSIRWLSFDLQSNLLPPVFTINVSDNKFHLGKKISFFPSVRFSAFKTVLSINYITYLSLFYMSLCMLFIFNVYIFTYISIKFIIFYS